MVTATLRKSWGLEAILREAASAANAEHRGKPRTDHRHHAVDAVTIALTSQAMVQRMSVAAASAPGWQQDRRVFRGMEAPWPNFVDSIRPHIEQMIVSHRPEHKMSGALHDETNYGRPYLEGKKTYVHIRKPVTALSPKELTSIVDPVVMAAVQQKAESLGGDLSKCEAADDWPLMPNKDGKSLPIRRVRIRKVLDVTPIAGGFRQRFVAANEIHHFELFVRRNGRKEIWCHVPVTLYEAFQRQRRGEDVVSRVLAEEPDAEFLCSLMKGDSIEINYDGARRVFRVKKFYSAGSIWLTHVNNAQKDDDQKREKTTWSKRPNELKALHPRKVVVDLLGRAHPAND